MFDVFKLINQKYILKVTLFSKTNKLHFHMP